MTGDLGGSERQTFFPSAYTRSACITQVNQLHILSMLSREMRAALSGRPKAGNGPPVTAASAMPVRKGKVGFLGFRV